MKIRGTRITDDELLLMAAIVILDVDSKIDQDWEWREVFEYYRYNLTAEKPFLNEWFED